MAGGKTGRPVVGSMRVMRPAQAGMRILAAASVLGMASSAPAAARPALLCDVRQADVTRRFEARPTDDPHGVVSHDIDGRFRFKAVVGAGTTGEAAYVKLYVHDMAVKGAPVLLHMATHQPPWPANHDVPALTGWNHVYSSVLGRELVYGCAWQGDTP